MNLCNLTTIKFQQQEKQAKTQKLFVYRKRKTINYYFSLNFIVKLIESACLRKGWKKRKIRENRGGFQSCKGLYDKNAKDCL